MFSILLNSISLLITLVIPTITAYTALESDSTDSFKPLIMYWVVYTILTTIESNFYFILKFIPFYHFIKLYLSLWLILPQSKGFEYIYFNFIKPLLNKYETDVENWIKELKINKLFGLLISSEKSEKQENPSRLSSLTDVLFKDQHDSRNATNNISIVGSLVKVIQGFPLGKIGGSPPTDNISAGTETELESTNSPNEYDVVEKPDIDLIKDQVLELSKSGNWLQSWWSPKTSRHTSKEKDE